jgi:hypothetical protein
MTQDLPQLGVGLGFRVPFRADIFRYREAIDFLEITADHYLEASAVKLEELQLLLDHFTLVPHSLDLSLGSSEGVDGANLEKLARLIGRVEPPWFSDHLCFTRSGGVAIGHLAPVPFTAEAAEVFARNIRRVRSVIGVPLILENIAYLMRYPSSEMTEAEFLTRVATETDSGILLDITNLYVNSVNFGFPAGEFLDSIPRERVVQVHFVGSRRNGKRLIDAHLDPTEVEVWELFRQAADRFRIKGAVLERDGNFPAFDQIAAELETARSIIGQWN